MNRLKRSSATARSSLHTRSGGHRWQGLRAQHVGPARRCNLRAQRRHFVCEKPVSHLHSQKPAARMAPTSTPRSTQVTRPTACSFTTAW